MNFCSQKNKEDDNNDRELFKHYDKFFNQLKSVNDSNKIETNKKLLDKLRASNILPSIDNDPFFDDYALSVVHSFFKLFESILSTTAEKLMVAEKLYIDLQHPLLKKYGFDIFEFAEGAKESCQRIIAAECSIDFGNVLKKSLTTTKKGIDEHEFLKQVLCLNIFNGVVKEFEESGLGELNSRANIKVHGVNVSKISIMGIEVEIVDPPLNKSIFRINDEFVYPNDSVLVHVELQTDMNLLMNDPKTTIINPETIKLTSDFVFTGCISGQIELNWRVTEKTSK